MTRILQSLIHGLLLIFGAILIASVIWVHSTGTTEFTQDYLAGRALLERSNIYGQNIIDGAKVLFPTSLERIENFHPPINALIFAPLAMLNYQTAHLVWCLVVVLLFFLALELTLKSVQIPEAVGRHLPYFAMLWWPAIYCVAEANISILVVLILALGFYLLKRDRCTLSAAILGVAAAIKLYPALLAIVFLLKRDLRALLVMVAVFLAVNLLAFEVVGAGQFWHYYLLLVPRDVAEWSAFPLNSSISGLLFPILTTSQYVDGLGYSQTFAKYLSYAVSLALLFITCRRLTSRGASVDGLAVFAVLIPLMLLASPITWPHAFCTILIPIACLLRPLIRDGGALAWSLFALSLLALSIPEVYVVRTTLATAVPDKLPLAIFLALKFPFFAVCILWGLSLKFLSVESWRD